MDEEEKSLAAHARKSFFDATLERSFALPTEFLLTLHFTEYIMPVSVEGHHDLLCMACVTCTELNCVA